MFNFVLAAGTGGMLLTIAVIFLAMWFLMIRPQKKQEKRDAEMRGALEVGDEVTTIGGIIGKVVSIKGETFVLETTRDKTKIRFLKGAIRSVDVKAADIAAAVMTEKAENTENAENKENADANAAEAPVSNEMAKDPKAEAAKAKAEAAKAKAEAKAEAAKAKAEAKAAKKAENDAKKAKSAANGKSK